MSKKFKDKHKPYTSPTLNKSPVIKEVQIERKIQRMLRAQERRSKEITNRKVRFVK